MEACTVVVGLAAADLVAAEETSALLVRLWLRKTIMNVLGNRSHWVNVPETGCREIGRQRPLIMLAFYHGRLHPDRLFLLLTLPKIYCSHLVANPELTPPLRRIQCRGPALLIQ